MARGRCLPYGEGITFWPLLEAVKEAVGLVDSDSPEQAQAKLAGFFGDEEAAEHLAQRLAETIGLADVSGRSEEGFESVRALLDALARIQPLVVVFDDIHWGERPSSISSSDSPMGSATHRSSFCASPGPNYSTSGPTGAEESSTPLQRCWSRSRTMSARR